MNEADDQPFQRRSTPSSFGVISGLTVKSPDHAICAKAGFQALCRTRLARGDSHPISSVILFEVKIGQIHVATGQDVNGENIPSLVEANLEEIRRQVPMMPLTPSHGVSWVVG